MIIILKRSDILFIRFLLGALLLPLFSPSIVFSGEIYAELSSVESSRIIDELSKKQNEIKAAEFKVFQTIEMEDISNEQEIEVDIKMLKPDKFYMRYRRPQEQYIVTNGHNVWSYVPKYSQVTIGSVDNSDRGSFEYFMGIIFSPIKNVLKQYNIRISTREIGTTKIYKMDMEHIEHESPLMSVLIGSADLMPYMLFAEYTDTKVIIKIEDIRVNSKIPEAYFDFIVPSGVDVVDLREDRYE